MRIMRAAVYYGPKDLRIERRDPPKPGDGEIVIKPVVVGVCPTDIKIYYRGSHSIRTPIILGHEISGIVVDKSPNVGNLDIGDHVNIAADAPCNSCRLCKRGYHNLCVNMISLGFNVDGGYATLMRVPKRFVDLGLVFKLPEHVSFEEAALIEPVAVSLHALSLVRPTSEDNVVVIGDGPNALIHVKLLRYYFNVNKVIVIGLMDHRLKAAMKVGADKIINYRSIGSPEELGKEIGIPIDVIDVTISNSETLSEAKALVDRGSRVVLFGGSPEDIKIDLTVNDIHYKQLVVTGSSGTSLDNYVKAVKLVTSGIIVLNDLISHRFTLDDILEAFETARLSKGLKVVITP